MVHYFSSPTDQYIEVDDEYNNEMSYKHTPDGGSTQPMELGYIFWKDDMWYIRVFACYVAMVWDLELDKITPRWKDTIFPITKNTMELMLISKRMYVSIPESRGYVYPKEPVVIESLYYDPDTKMWMVNGNYKHRTESFAQPLNLIIPKDMGENQ